MNEPRSPSIKLTKKLPKNKGRFLTETRVDLYQAKQWSEKFIPSSPKRNACAFYTEGGVVHLFRSVGVEKFYRIKVNDTWHSPHGKQYEFYTEGVAYQILGDKQ